ADACAWAQRATLAGQRKLIIVLVCRNLQLQRRLRRRCVDRWNGASSPRGLPRLVVTVFAAAATPLDDNDAVLAYHRAWLVPVVGQPVVPLTVGDTAGRGS